MSRYASDADSEPDQALASRTPPDDPADRFGVAREILSALETLTNAGRRHFMAKVVVFMEGQVAEAAPDPTGCRRDASMALLAQLKRESSRPLPDLTAFRHQGQRTDRASGAARSLKSHRLLAQPQPLESVRGPA